jgi:hypothetical protein
VAYCIKVTPQSANRHVADVVGLYDCGQGLPLRKPRQRLRLLMLGELPLPAEPNTASFSAYPSFVGSAQDQMALELSECLFAARRCFVVSSASMFCCCWWLDRCVDCVVGCVDCVVVDRGAAFGEDGGGPPPAPKVLAAGCAEGGSHVLWSLIDPYRSRDARRKAR